MVEMLMVATSVTVLIIMILFALLLKILVMIEVFGWGKTKELLKYPKWVNFTPIELTNALEEIAKKRGEL